MTRATRRPASTWLRSWATRPRTSKHRSDASRRRSPRKAGLTAGAALRSRVGATTSSASGPCGRNPWACSATCRATSGRSRSWKTRRCRRRTSPSYIAEFRAALDRRGLVYGMFGHVDAGVLHVRPALDMKDPAQEKPSATSPRRWSRSPRARRPALGRAWQGRALQFSPRFFGPLYPTLQAIKAAFDPGNQLNPGKIAVPSEDALLTVDGVPMKGQFDRTIPPAVRAPVEEVCQCRLKFPQKCRSKIPHFVAGPVRSKIEGLPRCSEPSRDAPRRAANGFIP